MQVREGGLDEPQVIALLEFHASGMLAHSPVDACHFLDLSALRSPDVTFLTCWDGNTLLGMGALKLLGDGSGEIKSMRTAEIGRGRGVGATILNAIIARARGARLGAIKLETGTGPAFDAAHRLYQRHGFAPCDAFGGYVATEFNRFYTLTL